MCIYMHKHNHGHIYIYMYMYIYIYIYTHVMYILYLGACCLEQSDRVFALLLWLGFL